ncbi:hypothetical protein [Pseudomonas putida]|uniref:hypothetical protein n=1 Tax=Pseudomonas putida TaxID=303 RepID=UPI0023E42113|nr:hypothetical protein [Pseudomonas putida]MDF3930158.1 hypothetical protein [Pseudomonas putida]
MSNIHLTKSSCAEPIRTIANSGIQGNKPGIRFARKFDWLALLLLTGQGMKPGTYVHSPGN